MYINHIKHQEVVRLSFSLNTKRKINTTASIQILNIKETLRFVFELFALKIIVSATAET